MVSAEPKAEADNTCSGARLIRTPRGHAIVSVLSGCPYEAGSQRKRQEHMFYGYKDQSRQFDAKFFNFLTVTVTSSS